MPQIRPFRALRFDPSAVGDLADVIIPAAESVDAAEHERLLARHPANVVRVDLPEDQSGDQPEDRFRRAARALAEWRSGAILHKDPHPSIYVYERIPGAVDGAEGRQLGYFARLRLVSEDDEPGIELPVVQADPTATEGRYRLVRATGINSSPVIGLYGDSTASATRATLEPLMERPADTDVIDDTGVRHRLWAVPVDGSASPTADALLAPAAGGPISIVGGRPIYDSALRYRDERRMSRSCEEDPPFDYVLALLIERSDAPAAPSAAIGLVLNPHEW